MIVADSQPAANDVPDQRPNPLAWRLGSSPLPWPANSSSGQSTSMYIGNVLTSAVPGASSRTQSPVLE